MAPRQIYKNAAGKRLKSVTTVTNRFKDSQGLLYWANSAGLDGLTLDEARIPAASAGTLAHDMVEAHINNRDMPETAHFKDQDMVKNAQSAFNTYLEWQAAFKIEVQYTEVNLVSEKHQFGGRLDAIGTWKNGLCLIDWKTSNAVYADMALQIAGYAIAWEETYPDHPLKGGFHLCRFAKEKGDFAHYHFPELNHERETFLCMVELYDRMKVVEKRIK